MNYPKTLAAVALALAAPATITSLGATPAGAAAAGGPSRLQSAELTTTTTTGARSGRILGEITPGGRAPAGVDLTAPTREAGGGDTHWPSASDSLSAGPWCVYQCITKGVAYEHGDGVRLVVETSVEAEIILIVCRDDDGNAYDCEYLDYNSSGAGVTEFEWVIDPLPAGTYWVTAAATDSTGTSHGFGEFTLT